MRTPESRIDVGQFVSNLLACQYREVMMAFATLAVAMSSVVFFPGFGNLEKGLDANVSLGLLAALVLVAVVAGIVKGMIGFGYGLITTPIFVTVIDPTFAVVILAVPPWMINIFQVGETDTGRTFIREEWLLVTLAVVGTILGVIFLAEFSTGPVVPFLIGLTIFGYVVFQVVRDFVIVERFHNSVALGTAGFLEGFLVAAASLGPLLPAYFHTFERDTERYIGGLSMVLAVIFTIRIVQMILFTDLLTTYRLWLGSVIAVVTVIGLFLGTYLRRLEVDERKFNWFVVALLFVISLNIFWNTIPALFF